MEGLDFGWRGGILLLAAVVAAYLLFALLKLFRLQRKPASAVAEPPAVAQPESPAMVVSPAPQIVPEPVPVFREQLAWSSLEAEVRQLRGELAALQAQVEALKVSRRVSPMYADALDLAQRGFDARGVAEECGISVAEAELVLAMARDKTDFDREVEDDGPGQRVSAESPGR